MFFSEASKAQQHVLHPQQGLFVMTLVVLTFKLFAQDVAAKGLELGSTGPPNLQKKQMDGWELVRHFADGMMMMMMMMMVKTHN